MLKELVDILTYDLLGLEAESAIGAAVNFFIYDSIKILFLLYLMIFAIGILRSYIPRAKVKTWLSKKGILSYVFAALFGMITPFCSCSSIPLFISFIAVGAPLGAAFTFLITSPLINEYLVVLMLDFFGLKITLAYILSGLALGITAGLIVTRAGLEGYLEKDIQGEGEEEKTFKRFKERIHYGHLEASKITRSLWMWVLLGVAIGAFIHGFVPQDLIESGLGTVGVFSVPLAVVMGVPVYANCAGIIPVAVALFGKGVPVGTSLAFMMAASALSIPEAVMLRRVMKLRLILIFFGMTAAGIVVIGYFLNTV